MKIDNLSLSFGTAEVYKNLTVEFNENDRSKHIETDMGEAYFDIEKIALV